MARIRRLRKSEVGEAARIIESNWPGWGKTARKEIGMMFQSLPLGPVYLAAEEKGRIVGLGGYCQSAINYPIYEVFWLNVKRECQGRGIGTRLLKAMVREMRGKRGEDRAKVILLSALSERLFTRLGFKRLIYYGKGHTLMAREFKS